MFKTFTRFVLILSLLTVVHSASIYLGSAFAGAPTTVLDRWGVPASSGYFNLTVVNCAQSGSSSRTWIRDGLWPNTKALLNKGDYVVIELGHNDGGGPNNVLEKGCVGGEGNETATVTLKNGTTEVVHTFGYYIGLMINDAIAKGARPIVSSATPKNPYENSAMMVNSPSRFEGYARNVAATKGVPFFSHNNACIAVYTGLGKAATESFFPFDHTHTNAAGAKQVANAFIAGLKCPSAKAYSPNSSPRALLRLPQSARS